MRRQANAVWTKVTPAVIIVCSTFIVICWALHTYLLHAHHTPSIAKPPTRLDRAYTPETDFDIVVSMYKEAPSTLNGTLTRILSLSTIPLNPRVFIYTKDENVNLASLQTFFPQAQIIRRPNIGREGETYLHYILANWDSLAHHTLFTQAGVDHLGKVQHRIDNYFIPERTGMLNLGSVPEVCDCHQCADPYWHDYSGTLAKVYEMANNRTCGWLMLTYKGQFIASAARIRGAGREVYQYLHDALTGEGSWAHQPEYLKEVADLDSMNAPALGYSLERLWGGILQCADLTVVGRCPNMESGWRGKGTGMDCQCFDD